MSEPRPLFEAPRAAAWLAPYWEGLARHELRLPRCSVCGRWQWYPVAAGPACKGAEYHWQAIDPLVTVFTYSRVARPLLPSIAEPYATGLVVSDTAPGCRIAARLVGAPDDIRIGARARLRFSGEGDRSFPYFVVEGGR